MRNFSTTRNTYIDSLLAEALGRGIHFYHPYAKANRSSIDEKPPSSIDIRLKPPSTVSEKTQYDNQYLTQDEFDIFRDPYGYARAMDGHTLQISREDIAEILRMANGADNLFMQQCNSPAHQQRVTNDFYDTAGGVDDRFKQKFRQHTRPSIDVDIPSSIDRRPEFGKLAYDRDGTRRFQWEETDENGVYGDDQGHARDVEGHIIRIYTKDEINEMFYGVCGAQEKNEGDFQMKLVGVYYPLNDSISWLTTCMEEMRQDIAKIQTQHAAKATAPVSIDRHHSTSIDDDLTHSNPMKSQPDSYTRAENDELVEGIYKTLETTEERLDRRCDDIYFPMDLTMSSLTSQIEAIQREIVEIQRYIARRPETSTSINRCNNKSTDSHRRISVDEATNRGRLVPKVKSDMSDTHNHGEEILDDVFVQTYIIHLIVLMCFHAPLRPRTYVTLIRNQFQLESLDDRLQKIENATASMRTNGAEETKQ
ncbi:hypothetical protein F2Q69_00047423 [Brassica cretica]|uniref:Uncharacterized protein n=1 Tax=Brassica cretica TaxID=69181 RepID=A0A8S9PV34_BRACR|nr:hypothetical protein F2Q69_00047423 [Brassica cretica]